MTGSLKSSSLWRARARLKSLGGGAAAMAIALSIAGNAVAQDLESVSLRLKWLTQAQFAGFYVAQAKDYYKEEGIDLTINSGGPNLNAEALVASGADDFGLTGGVESHLAARDKGLPLVAIGVVHLKTPYAFVAYDDSGIKSLEDMKGKRLSTWYTGAQYTLAAVLATAGLKDGDYTLMPQSVSMNPFIERDVDVATVTLYNELNVLKSRGIDNLILFQPDDYGVTIQRDTLVTTESLIESKPELVQGFLTASLRGWKYALQNKDEAIDILLKADPGLERPHQEAMLDVIEEVMLAGKGASDGLAAIDFESLQRQHDLLFANGVMQQPVDLQGAFDPSFWEKVPDEYKKL